MSDPMEGLLMGGESHEIEELPKFKPAPGRMAVTPMPFADVPHEIDDDSINVIVPDIGDPPDDMIKEMAEATGKTTEEVKEQVATALAEAKQQFQKNVRFCAGLVVYPGHFEGAQRQHPYEKGDVVYYPLGRGLKIGEYLMLPAEAVICFDDTGRDKD